MIHYLKDKRKKRGIPGIPLIGLICCCLLCACGQEEPLPVSGPGYLKLQLMLQLPQQVSILTRATDTGITDGNDGTSYTITDVRVFQITATAMTMKYYAETGGDFIPVTGGDPWAKVESDMLTVYTNDDDFTDTDCSFYIVVNAGSTFPTVSSLNDLQQVALDLATPADIATIEPVFFSCGPVSYKKESGSTAKPIQFIAKLTRMHAKLTVDYTTQPGVTINEVKIENVPQQLFPLPNKTADYRTPTQSDKLYQSLTLTPAIHPTKADTYTFSTFLPENIRGSGIATLEPEKNKATCGPVTVPGASPEKRNVTNCTCIVLTGTYDYYPDDNTSIPINVEYRFYPGADMIRSYNIERGKHYQMDINLLGANSADARVTITDGNVFTILDPDDTKGDKIEF